MIRSAENDELLLPVELPLALYDVEDEADSEFCSDCKNCCRMSLVVLVELAAIAWVRHRFMDTPFLAAAFQVVVGGVLVFIAGILIGSS